MLRSLPLLLLACGLALPAAAQPFPSEPPAPGEPRPFELPEGRHFTLDNGIEVRLVPFGQLPKVDVRAAVRTGSVDEAAGETGLAALMGRMMDEGTARRSAAEVAEAAASMGGSVGAWAGLEEASVYGDGLSEYAPDLVRLVAEVLREPALPASEMERVKRDYARSLTIAASQPGNVAQDRFRRALYGSHAYGRTLTDPAAVQGHTAEDVRRFYDRHVHAGRTRLYVVGQFDQAAVEAAIREAFAGWEGGAAADPARPEPQRARRILLVDQPGAAQTNLVLGLPTIDPTHRDYVALQVTNALLGGSFASRVTQNIREDKGYTYSPYSTVSARYRDAHWAQVAAVTTDVTGPAVREVLYEIERLQGEPPSAEELEGIQNYLAGTFVLSNSSRQGVLNQLAFLDFHGLPRTYLTGYVQRVHAVTPEDVQRVAREYLRPDQMALIAVGDRSLIEAQLAPFGEIEVME